MRHRPGTFSIAVRDRESDAFGAPVRNRHGRVLGSISVSGPVKRMKQPDYHEELVEHVVNTANVIEVDVNMEETEDEFPTFS